MRVVNACIYEVVGEARDVRYRQKMITTRLGGALPSGGEKMVKNRWIWHGINISLKIIRDKYREKS